MSKHSGETKKPGVFVDCGRLYGSDLMPAEILPHDIETA